MTLPFMLKSAEWLFLRIYGLYTTNNCHFIMLSICSFRHYWLRYSWFINRCSFWIRKGCQLMYIPIGGNTVSMK